MEADGKWKAAVLNPAKGGVRCSASLDCGRDGRSQRVNSPANNDADLLRAGIHQKTAGDQDD